MILKIMLPTMLLNAAVFELPPSRSTRYGIFKTFIWHDSTGTEVSHNNNNSALLHTPKKAGGFRMASILIECKTQRVK